MTLQNLLHNPAYAGIYAYGRRRVDPRRQDPARPSTGRVVRSRDGWHVMIPNVLPAYITVAQFEANEAKLAANRARAEAMGRHPGRPRARGRAGALRTLQPAHERALPHPAQQGSCPNTCAPGTRPTPARRRAACCSTPPVWTPSSSSRSWRH
ncbi:recombinase family protein [Streptomyces actuosus]|uniref:Recombinase family protein n=1 Tax=Streptomyces actuosus TaxID=1885 RepID=A0ABS2VZC0_STRAS|nr:recombinase family protein [Streptomyces actuosus]